MNFVYRILIDLKNVYVNILLYSELAMLEKTKL